MSYDDLKQTILKKIDDQKNKVKIMIENATKCEDWEDIQDDINFIIQAHGSIMVIDRLQGIDQKVDEKAEPEEKDDKTSD